MYVDVQNVSGIFLGSWLQDLDECIHATIFQECSRELLFQACLQRINAYPSWVRPYCLLGTSLFPFSPARESGFPNISTVDIFLKCFNGSNLSA